MNVNQKGCFAEYKFATAAMECGLNVSMPLLDSSIYDCIVEHEGRLSKVQIKNANDRVQSEVKKGVHISLRPNGTFYNSHLISAELRPELCRYQFMTVSLLFQMKNNAPSGLFAAESIPIFLITLHHSSISRISLFNKEKASNLFGVFFCIFVK